MTIEVKDLGDYEFQISWDKNDPKEKLLNYFTEQDFIDAIQKELNLLNGNLNPEPNQKPN